MELLTWTLLDPTGRLRAGWRVLVHLAMVLWLGFAAILMMSTLIGWLISQDLVGDLRGPTLTPVLLQGVLLGPALILATAASALVLEARWPRPSALGSLGDAGQSLRLGRGVVEIVLGVLIAWVALGVTLVGMNAHYVGIEWGDLELSGLPWFLATAVGLVFAAWFEELLFRGYLYQWIGGGLARLGHWAVGHRGGVLGGLIDVVAFAGPALALSVLFGLAHLANPSATWLSTTNTVLAGVWFTVLVLRTRSLWPAVSAHIAWNATLLLVLGLPVSGIGTQNGYLDLPQTLLWTRVDGPWWLTGEAYGPEGSIACIGGLLVAIVLSALLPRRRPEHGFSAARRLDPSPRPADPLASAAPVPEGGQGEVAVG